MAEDSLLGRTPDVAEVNRSGWKIIVTIVVPAIIATGASYLFLSGHAIWSCVLALVFINLFALQTFFLKTSQQIWLALCLSTIGFLVPFFSVNLNNLGVTALVILFFFVTGTFSGRHELNNSLRISFSKVARKAMVGATTGMVGGITVLVVCGALGPSAFSADNIAHYFIDPYVVAPSVEYVLHQQYVPDETARYFITSEVESSPSLANLPTKSKDQLIAAAVDASVSQLETSIGSSINLDSSISSNIIQIAENKISEMPQPGQLIVVSSLYLILWSTVALLATILSYILSISAFLFFELLVMTRFAEIQMESRTHEMVTLQ